MEADSDKAAKIIFFANKLTDEYLTIDHLQSFIVETLNKYAKIQGLKLDKGESEKIKNGEDIQ